MKILLSRRILGLTVNFLAKLIEAHQLGSTDFFTGSFQSDNQN